MGTENLHFYKFSSGSDAAGLDQALRTVFLSQIFLKSELLGSSLPTCFTVMNSAPYLPQRLYQFTSPPALLEQDLPLTAAHSGDSNSFATLLLIK